MFICDARDTFIKGVQASLNNRSVFKINGTIRFLDLTNIDLRHQNRHPKCFSSKVVDKDIFFFHNGGQCNTFMHAVYVSCLECFYLFIERPLPKLPCVKKFSNIFTYE